MSRGADGAGHGGGERVQWGDGVAMITRIEGAAKRWNEESQSVEVEVGGLWYEVLLPTYCWRAMEERPERVEFYIYYHVPERAPTPVLIGFLRPVEREFFKKFLTVRGMGPAKVQRALATSVSTIAGWIEAEDKASLRKLPGVGARQAEQIVAELKGKVVEEAMLRDEHYAEPAAATPPALEAALADAVEALVNLGYQRREAQERVAQVASADMSPPLTPDVEAVLRAVFGRMATDG